VVYPLDEVLLLSLFAVLAGAETFTVIARFGDIPRIPENLEASVRSRGTDDAKRSERDFIEAGLN
jgi:hypothetical protein